MTVSKRWVIAHAYLGTSGVLDQLTNFNLNPGIQTIELGFDGEVDITFVAPGNVAPTFSMDTVDIKTALDALGADGLALAGAETLTCYFQKVAKGGKRAAASSQHLEMVAAEGIVIPQTLTVTNNQAATLSMLCVATSPDGTALPIIVTDDQTYTASASSVEGWTLGPVKPAGTDVDYTGNLSMTIDFGIDLSVTGSDGEGFPTFVFVNNRRMSITFTSTDASLIDTLSETGKQIASASTAIYLRKLSKVGNNVVRVATATTEHIKFTIPGLWGSPQTIGAAHGDPVVASVEFIPYSTDGATPITIDTASAIAANV